MKTIKLIIAAVLVMVGMSVSAQWTDNGTFSYTNDSIGIGYTSNPVPGKTIALGVSGESYFNQKMWLGDKLKALTASQRWDFGWGPILGANVEFYSNTHATAPGEMRFVFGGDGIGNINYLHYNGSTWNSCFYINHDGNVGIGTITPGSTLEVNGDIKANNLSAEGKITTQEVEVTLDGWSDYVFEEDYNLRPLDDVEKFIKTNKHLPGIPSEKDVLDNGVSLGDMNKKLLAKVEELTLYVIQLQKEIENLKKD